MLNLLKKTWRGFKSTFVLQAEEYRASVQSLNIFFGAIIGVSFARIENMPMFEYASLLVITAAAVSIILIVSNTRRRIYSALNLLLMLAALWFMFAYEPIFEGIPDQLLPTLIVWAVMAILTEFTPRETPKD